MANPTAGIDPGTIAALIGIIVAGVQILGRVIDKLFAFIEKNHRKDPPNDLDGTLEKVSERMFDMIITQKDISANQLQIIKSLDSLNDRLEKDVDDLGARIDRRMDQFEKHLP